MKKFLPSCGRFRTRSLAVLAFAVSLALPTFAADLVLLAAHPLTDIRNTRSVEAVWVGGRRAER